MEEIIKFIVSNGYGAQEPDANQAPDISDNRIGVKSLVTIVSGIFLALGFVINWIADDKSYATYLFAVAMITGGYYVYRSALTSLRSLILDMNVLMTVSSVGAVFIGEWSEAATVVFLFSVGNMLQASTLEKTRKSISRMIEMSPREARILSSSGTEKAVPVNEVRPGDTVLVKPGEYIPVDGIVAAGFSWVNQSPITGESRPIEKTIGDAVFAGTVNNEGFLKITVKREAADSTLAKMIDMVEEAQARKAPSQQFIDKFARYYTPVVIIGAILVVVIPVVFLNMPFSEWFYKALVLLVISCPCALVISTPVTIVSAIGNAARNGVLIKGGAYLEALGKVKSIAFDKTGTITTGQLVVTRVVTVGGVTEKQLLETAAAVERFSEHPIAKAVLNECNRAGSDTPLSEGFISYPGKGARSSIEGRFIYVGNKRLMEELGISTDQIITDEQALELSGHSLVYVSSDESLLGLIAISDKSRHGVKELLVSLKEAGVEEILMLSGDNEAVVSRVAAEVGIESYAANLLPEDKVKRVEELTTKGVSVMVGDGVNDAPALAVTTVGIAMGAAGTDSALETADVALMNDELSKISFCLNIGRKTLSIIKQNVVLAISLKVIFLILTFAGISNLWMAVFADTGASVLVTLNGMRLAQLKE